MMFTFLMVPSILPATALRSPAVTIARFRGTVNRFAAGKLVAPARTPRAIMLIERATPGPAFRGNAHGGRSES